MPIFGQILLEVFIEIEVVLKNRALEKRVGQALEQAFRFKTFGPNNLSQP